MFSPGAGTMVAETDRPKEPPRARRTASAGASRGSSASVEGILSATLWTFGRDPKGFLLPSLIPAAGVYAIAEWFSLAATGSHVPDLLASGVLPSETSPVWMQAPAILAVAILAFVALFVVTAVIQAGLACHAFWLHRGRRSTVDWAIRMGARHSLEVMAATLLITLVVVLSYLFYLVPLLLAVVFANSGFLVFLYPGLLLSTVLAAYAVVATAVYVPAIVVGRCGIRESLSRSAQLTHGHRRSVFASMVVLGLVEIPFTIPLLVPTGDPSLVALQLGWATLGLTLYFGLSAAAAGASYDLLLTPWKGSRP